MTDIVERLYNFNCWSVGRERYEPIPVCKEAAGEIERLRAASQAAQDQVDRARGILSSIDLSWLETFREGPDGDYGWCGIGEDHKAFWRDAIAFLETSGGRPSPLPRMTEAELIDALDATYPPLPSATR